MASISGIIHSSSQRRPNRSSYQLLDDCPDVSCWNGIEGTTVRIEPDKVSAHVQTESAGRVSSAAAVLGVKKQFSQDEFIQHGKNLIQSITVNSFSRFRELYAENPLVITYNDENGHNILYHALHNECFQITQFILDNHPEFKEDVYELLLNPNLYSPMDRDLRIFILMLFSKGYIDVNKCMAYALVGFNHSKIFIALDSSVRIAIAYALYETGGVDVFKVHELIEKQVQKRGFAYSHLLKKDIRSKVSRCLTKCAANRNSHFATMHPSAIQPLILHHSNGRQLLQHIRNNNIDAAKLMIERDPTLLEFKGWRGRSILFDALLSENLDFCVYLAKTYPKFAALIPSEVSSYLSFRDCNKTSIILSLLELRLVDPQKLVSHILTTAITDPGWPWAGSGDQTAASFTTVEAMSLDLKNLDNQKYFHMKLSLLLTQLSGKYSPDYNAIHEEIKRIAKENDVEYTDGKKKLINRIMGFHTEN